MTRRAPPLLEQDSVRARHGLTLKGGDKPMGYIRDLERELREMLKDLPEDKIEAVLKFVKDRVYQSYKNGVQAKDKPQPVTTG